MARVTTRAFKEFCKGFEDTTLATHAQKRKFSVAVVASGLEFTPEATGKSRPMSNDRIALVLERYNETNSLRPADYQDITVNASYLLTLLRKYLESR